MSKVKYISAEELKALRVKNPTLTICDIRGSGEYNSGHIPEAINIPIGGFDRSLFTGIEDKESIIFHCLSGTRTRMNESKLITAPFKNIYILKNGITEWKRAGGEVSGSGAGGAGIVKNLLSFAVVAAVVWTVMHFIKTFH